MIHPKGTGNVNSENAIFCEVSEPFVQCDDVLLLPSRLG